MKKLRNFVIGIFSVEILIMLYWILKAGCEVPPVPVTDMRNVPSEVVPLGDVDSNAAPDLTILGNDSLGRYNGWCSDYPCDIYGGLRAGDWGLFGDSTRYACPVANVAIVPHGGDSSKYAYVDIAGYHPGLITVAVFYRGKRYDGYVSKSSYDFGNTNCLFGVQDTRTWASGLMGISVGCLDRYDPQIYSKPFEHGDKIVVVVWVNKDRRIREQNYDNNVGILPWRRDTLNATGWMLDWSAMKRNEAAIKKWVKNG